MYNEAKDRYIYAIAGGETLQIIAYLEKQVEQTKQDLIDYVASFGVEVTKLDGFNHADIKYGLKDENTPIPAGWAINTNRAGTFLEPAFYDENGLQNEDGMKIDAEISKFQNKMNIQEQFDNLCHSLAPSSNIANRKYSFETVGEHIVVTIPKQREGDAIIPTGSQPITFLGYIQLLEQAKPTPAPITREFKNRFQPN